MHSPSSAKVAMDRLNTRSTKRDFVDSSSIRKNQVLLIITAIFFQFHLPYFSLAPVNSAGLDIQEGLVAGFPLEQGAETVDFIFNEREIPYLESKNDDVDLKDDSQPKLLGIHIDTQTNRRSPRVYSVGESRTILVTAYSSTKDQTDSSPCITANGYNVCRSGVENVIAANFLPFGARVRFPEYFGDREFVVQDRMHARYSNRVDIWMKSRAAAKQFGVKRLKMEIVQNALAQESPERTQIAGNF